MPMVEAQTQTCDDSKLLVDSSCQTEVWSSDEDGMFLCSYINGHIIVKRLQNIVDGLFNEVWK